MSDWFSSWLPGRLTINVGGFELKTPSLNGGNPSQGPTRIAATVPTNNKGSANGNGAQNDNTGIDLFGFLRIPLGPTTGPAFVAPTNNAPPSFAERANVVGKAGSSKPKTGQAQPRDPNLKVKQQSIPSDAELQILENFLINNQYSRIDIPQFIEICKKINKFHNKDSNYAQEVKDRLPNLTTTITSIENYKIEAGQGFNKSEFENYIDFFYKKLTEKESVRRSQTTQSPLTKSQSWVVDSSGKRIELSPEKSQPQQQKSRSIGGEGRGQGQGQQLHSRSSTALINLRNESNATRPGISPEEAQREWARRVSREEVEKEMAKSPKQRQREEEERKKAMMRRISDEMKTDNPEKITAFNGIRYTRTGNRGYYEKDTADSEDEFDFTPMLQRFEIKAKENTDAMKGKVSRAVAVASLGARYAIDRALRRAPPAQMSSNDLKKWGERLRWTGETNDNRNSGLEGYGRGN